LVKGFQKHKQKQDSLGGRGRRGSKSHRTIVSALVKEEGGRGKERRYKKGKSFKFNKNTFYSFSCCVIIFVVVIAVIFYTFLKFPPLKNFLGIIPQTALFAVAACAPPLFCCC